MVLVVVLLLSLVVGGGVGPVVLVVVGPVFVVVVCGRLRRRMRVGKCCCRCRCRGCRAYLCRVLVSPTPVYRLAPFFRRPEVSLLVDCCYSLWWAVWCAFVVVGVCACCCCSNQQVMVVVQDAVEEVKRFAGARCVLCLCVVEVVELVVSMVLWVCLCRYLRGLCLCTGDFVLCACVLVFQQVMMEVTVEVEEVKLGHCCVYLCDCRCCGVCFFCGAACCESVASVRQLVEVVVVCVVVGEVVVVPRQGVGVWSFQCVVLVAVDAVG